LVDRAESGLKGKDVKYYYWHVYEVEIDNGDTITLSEFNSTDNLKTAQLNRKDNGDEVTCTHAAGNVVTVADAGITSTTPCILYAFGRKA
jgi:hypothetical protein